MYLPSLKNTLLLKYANPHPILWCVLIFLQESHQRAQVTITNIIIMKMFEILEHLQKYDTETQSELMFLGKW